jgi:hypothetical protein
VLRIGGNKIYNQKNKILMMIPEFKRSGIRIIADFHGIQSRFPNQAPIQQVISDSCSKSAKLDLTWTCRESHHIFCTELYGTIQTQSGNPTCFWSLLTRPYCDKHAKSKLV